MNLEIELFVLTLAVFIWLMSAWDALSQLSGGRVRRIEIKNRKLSRKAEEWVENKRSYEAVFKFIIFLAIAVLATIIFSYIRKQKVDWGNPATAGVAAVAIVLLVILVQLGTRALVYRFDIPLLRFTMPIIKALRYSIFFPFVMLFNVVDERAENWDQQEGENGRTSTEDEIMSLVEQDPEEEGEHSLEEDERRMIRGIFDLDDTVVREIMTPRVDITGLAVDVSVEEAKKEFIESGHSRIPVYQESIDEIKGIIYAKDFLEVEKIRDKNLMDLARQPIFIPETKEVGELLEEIKKTRNHFAVLIDEYGGTAGIVTLEDIIEEIVGEIQDEYDDHEDGSPLYSEQANGSILFDARIPIEDVNEMLEIDIPEDEDVDTIGGFVCGKLGKIPETGRQLKLEDPRIMITVIKADHRKVMQVQVEILEEHGKK